MVGFVAGNLDVCFGKEEEGYVLRQYNRSHHPRMFVCCNSCETLNWKYVCTTASCSQGIDGSRLVQGHGLSAAEKIPSCGSHKGKKSAFCKAKNVIRVYMYVGDAMYAMEKVMSCS